jgi:hypothetical protein
MRRRLPRILLPSVLALLVACGRDGAESSRLDTGPTNAWRKPGADESQLLADERQLRTGGDVLWTTCRAADDADHPLELVVVPQLGRDHETAVAQRMIALGYHRAPPPPAQ